MFCTPAMAQENISAIQEVIALNESRPAGNPNFEKAKKVLHRKISDRKNKIVGDVRDILINADGSIASLYVDFNKVGLGQPVYLDYTGMRVRASEGAYNLSFSDYQIEVLMPQILANTMTASGANDGVYNVRGMIGGLIRADDGRKVGRVETVLFTKDGSRAHSIVVDVGPHKKAALPFAAISRVQAALNARKSSRIFITDEYASAINAYVQN